MMRIALDFYLADGSHSVTAIRRNSWFARKQKRSAPALGGRRHRGFAGCLIALSRALHRAQNRSGAEEPPGTHWRRSGRSAPRNTPPARLTSQRASTGKQWLTPGTPPPRQQRERNLGLGAG